MGYGLQATDGDIGSVSDILFDDQDWAMRWVVVDTGNWLPGRKVLLPTSVLRHIDAGDGSLAIDVTRKQVEESPGVGDDEPVSRQMETDMYSYYGWSPYWYPGSAAMMPGYVPAMGGMATLPLTGASVPPGSAATTRAGGQPAGGDQPRGDPHLRSVQEVTGYYIHATDDDVGHVEEFLIDASDWTIRYVVVDTKNWWPGKHVLVAPKWIQEVDWGAQQVRLDITRQQVKTSPEYDPSASADRAYEERLHGHYGRMPYWT